MKQAEKKRAKERATERAKAGETDLVLLVAHLLERIRTFDAEAVF